MRNNYVGDVGDFYKYRLLRELCGATGREGISERRLGVVWYLYIDPCKATDGNHLSYLSPEKEAQYQPTDSVLYDKLKQLVAEGDRSVQAVRKRGVLPPDTCFYEEPLTLSHLPKGTSAAIDTRLAHRQRWLEGALKATECCNLIFFDPDNGLEVLSTKAHQDKGPKFVFYDELKPFWQRGQSLVIYQHKNMHQKADVQIAERKAELKERLGINIEIEAHYFPKFGGRIFFVLLQ